MFPFSLPLGRGEAFSRFAPSLVEGSFWSDICSRGADYYLRHMKGTLLLILSLFLLGGSPARGTGPLSDDKGKCSIVVDKGSFTLYLLGERGDTLRHYPVAIGENPGRKRRSGDCKTPEGTFKVTWVQNTKGVLYDYHDGNGKVEAYGPYFIHLDTPPFTAIGIHGTCKERVDRIGTRDSKGCIRLYNEDLLDLLKYVTPGMEVMVIPGKEDIEIDSVLDSGK